MKKAFMVMKVLIILFIIALLAPVSGINNQASAFSQQVIQHGAVGDDVIELQSRLQYLGFYNGKIDGVFGWGTYWALRNFQYEFGLEIDGLAGQTTKNILMKSSDYNESFVKEQINKGNKFTHYGGTDLEKQKGPSGGQGGATGGQSKPNPQGGNQGAAPKGEGQQNNPSAANMPSGFSENDIQIMANAVYGEARGEPYIGQVAVAAVILNRVGSASFPDTVSGVIFEPRAFTAVADGQIWLTPNETARQAVLDAINGTDPSGSALYYFNPNTATSPWIWTRPQIKKIGQHIFCK
ncbi:spore cortex-lytic enzyme [Cytobacillus purgationiresistens]|uniref:Spore cortex-lytic enzyme n=1 Tax=Cytobacillus purgationiresistens TaxID=863449 RepID=A0ABU0AIL7_9BACI|nr:spore cortex-lytic enzyme [Cytobacillus purgationiresistens]MDQ0271103.1 N-acetylmuramoyl-L-alanine amidase [Cytobacillus purgationiresistens]